MDCTYVFGVKRLKVVLNYRIKLTLHEFYPDETEVKQNRLGQLTLGNKQYELSNHLGNVLTVISDRKLGMKDTSGNLVLDTEGLIAIYCTGRFRTISDDIFEELGISEKEANRLTNKIIPYIIEIITNEVV